MSKKYGLKSHKYRKIWVLDGCNIILWLSCMKLYRKEAILIMESKVVFTNQNGKSITNFEITSDSILEIMRNKYGYETINIKLFWIN